MTAHRRSHLLKAFVAAIVIGFGFSAGAGADALQDKLAVFRADESGRSAASQWAEQISAARSLEWLGLSDPALFNIIEKNLLDTYMRSDKRAVEYASWMAKALGYSGQARYTATLEEVAEEGDHRKVRKNASAALQDLPRYTAWNPVISSRSAWRNDKSDLVNRYANMVRSGDLELQRMAAKRMSFEKLFDDWLLELLNKEVDARSREMRDDKLFIDSVAWMTKILAASGLNEYRPSVEDIAANAHSKKLRSYARKYIASYY